MWSTNIAIWTCNSASNLDDPKSCAKFGGIVMKPFTCMRTETSEWLLINYFLNFEIIMLFIYLFLIHYRRWVAETRANVRMQE